MIPFGLLVSLVLLSQQGSTLPSFDADLRDLHPLAQGQTELKDPTLGSEVSSGFVDLTAGTAPEVSSPHGLSDTDIPFGGEQRILGGTDAPLGSAPFQVSFRDAKGHFCGGSIVSNRCILTAAHCVVRIKKGTTKAVVGTISLTKGGVSYDVDTIASHPNYTSTINKYDIAVICVSKNITFTKNIQSISLPSKVTQDGKPLTLFGFGYNTWDPDVNSGTLSDLLQRIDRTVVNIKTCKTELSKIFPGRGGAIDSTQICNSSEKGKGACKGDSGGPVIGDSTLQGVISWSYPCATGRPEVNTCVFTLKKWIESKMK